MIKKPQYNQIISLKLKTALFLIIIFLFSQSAFSQFIWQKTYNSYIGGDDEGYDGCEADGSNFYIAGYTGILDYYMYVLKLNQLGDTLWTRTYIGGIANAVAPSGDGGCVFTGQRNSCFSMKLDLNGNVVWDKTYPNGAETRDIVRTYDSGYIMCGGFFSGYICKLDTVGNLQWERYYDDSPQDFNKIEPDINGGYIVCGRKFINSVWKAYLMKIDGSGNIVWESSYQYKFLISFAKSNSGFILAGGYDVGSNLKIVLTKTDNQGNEMISDTISTTTITDVRPQIIKINNNKYLISYYSQISLGGKYEGKILRIDTSLNVIKSINLFVDSNSVHLHNIMKAPGSNFDDIIGMGSSEPHGPFEVDLYAVRIDSSLTQPPPISVNIISNQLPQKSELILNYPNPFNGSTIIKFTVNKSSFVKIRVFDVLGREVEILVNEKMEPGVYNASWNATPYASGVYFYRLVADDFVSVKKMIVIK